MLLPTVWLIFASFDQAATQATKVPEEMTLNNFHRAFAGRSLRWILNSILIAGVAATFTLFVCTFSAYPFSRLSFLGKDAILFGYVLLRIIPVSTFMLPVYLIFAGLNLVNTYLSVILTLSVLNLPFALLLMKGFYDTIPRVFEEAAWTDGCGRTRTIFSIVLPQCGPGLAVAWFMTFMSSWNEFLLPFILLRKMDLMPLSVGIFTAYGEHGAVDFGLLSALSLVYAILPIIIYIFIQKHLVKGMVGYVKG